MGHLVRQASDDEMKGSDERVNVLWNSVAHLSLLSLVKLSDPLYAQGNRVSSLFNPTSGVTAKNPLRFGIISTAFAVLTASLWTINRRDWLILFDFTMPKR